MCNFVGVWWAVYEYGETFAPFAVVELGEVVLRVWKPRLLWLSGNFGVLFGDIGT